MKWEKNKRRGVAMYVEGVMVNSGDRTGDVTVVWDNKNEEWHHWTGLYHCLHLPLSHTHTLSLCFQCPLVRCVVVTWESAQSRHARTDHWSENEPRCQRVSSLHATQTDTNTATTRTWTQTFRNETAAQRYAYPLTQMWYAQLISFSEGPTASILSHTDIVEHTRVTQTRYLCLCVTVLLNNTSLTHQSCDFKGWHMLRKGGERDRGKWEVGGREGETKTKIQDEQWRGGQQRSDRWLSDSSQCLPMMLNRNTFCVGLTACLPVLSLSQPLGNTLYWGSWAFY